MHNRINITDLIKRQRKFFATGETRSLGFRKDRLSALEQMCENHETEILEAVHTDLHRDRVSTYLNQQPSAKPKVWG